MRLSKQNSHLSISKEIWSAHVIVNSCLGALMVERLKDATIATTQKQLSSDHPCR
jgi:hypothetical protein